MTSVQEGGAVSGETVTVTLRYLTDEPLTQEQGAKLWEYFTQHGAQNSGPGGIGRHYHAVLTTKLEGIETPFLMLRMAMAKVAMIVGNRHIVRWLELSAVEEDESKD
jgi:hypothetical protein